MKESWKEYKERQEAKNYFRQNNDQFLSPKAWFKTILAGLIGAVLMGIVHGAITMSISINFSILYIVIGYAVANIMTSVSGIFSHQIGIASSVITFFAFFVSRLSILTIAYSFFGVSLSVIVGLIPTALASLFNSGILNLIFVVVGVFVAYQQAQ